MMRIVDHALGCLQSGGAPTECSVQDVDVVHTHRKHTDGSGDAANLAGTQIFWVRAKGMKNMAIYLSINLLKLIYAKT